MHSVLIVDDHPFIRSAARMLLQQEQFDIVGETDNGVDALQLARQHLPDLILLDIAIPKMDGLEVLNRIAELQLPAKILVLTSRPVASYAMRCMKAGAAGYVSKAEDLNELVKAIRAIMSGYTFFPNLAANSVRRSDMEASEQDLIRRLSDRELSILQKLATGFSNNEIAEVMHVSNKTVSTYKKRIIEKLNVKSLVYLAEFAKRNDLV
ncbi:response regulator transcription factor [Pseudomonas entomophila]|uniref:response regulator transcription factor n=1 Tax=Pseudomonas entomophila TaxID=312306 RepID=UPI00240630DB|nr:response regulator transcription factor [Pseudomonas entomophila]MDF9618785.1 response regulator transcription factor [Pseudomonas entomophila]